MSRVISLSERLFISDASSPDARSIADEASPIHTTATVKYAIVVAGCILFLLSNSLCQTYYVRYASEEAESGGTYLLLWFSSIFQVLIYPIHMLAAWAHHRIIVFREGSSLESNALHSVTELIDRFRGPKRFTLFCLGMNALNFFGTYCWYLSLDLLPASFNFVVSKSAIVLAYLLSVPILSEPIDVFQGLVILAIIVGCVCVTMGKTSKDVQNVRDDLSLGLTLNMLQSLMSSLYNCLFKRFNPLPRPADVSFIMSLQGFITLLLFWPPLIFLQDINISVIQAKPAAAQFLFINALLAVSYYLVYAVGIVYSTASVMSIGGTLSVPAAAAIDSLVFRLSFQPVYILGCVIVPLAVMAAFMERAKVKPWPPNYAWLSRILIGRKLPK
jgi:drug/metabolite transporter (DMT)-like permease